MESLPRPTSSSRRPLECHRTARWRSAEVGGYINRYRRPTRDFLLRFEKLRMAAVWRHSCVATCKGSSSLLSRLQDQCCVGAWTSAFCKVRPGAGGLGFPLVPLAFRIHAYRQCFGSGGWNARRRAPERGAMPLCELGYSILPILPRNFC